MPAAVDPSVEGTRAARAFAEQAAERQRKLAPVVVAMRQAIEAARDIPTLAVWQRLAGRAIDHGWGSKPGIGDQLCRLAARAVERATTTELLVAANQAHSASLRWWQVQRDLPALVVKGGRRPRCEFCHEPFTASGPNQRYCGRSHARKAEYRRKAGRGVWRRQN